MNRPRRRLASCLAAGLLLAAGGASSSTPKRTPVKDWNEGPVRYILQRDEIKVFRALEDDESRLRFIDQFWLRRDPTPGTPENEFRNLFWSRVKYADERYADGTAPGWKSDRGKLYVLCGEPDKIETMPYADTQAGPTAGHGLIRWIYERRPCGRKDLGPGFIVAFVRESTGDYRMSTDPRLSSLYFRESDLTDETLLKINKWLDQVGISDRSELSVLADLGTLQQGPHPEERIVERVETSEAYGSRPLAVQASRFRHPRGGVLLVLTIEAPVVAAESTPSFVARLVPRDSAKAKRFLGEESFRLEGSGPNRVAQSRIVIEPGVWDVTVLSVESGVAKSGLFREAIEIRPPADDLSLSDLVLAQTLEPLPYRSLISYDKPFLVGAFRVVPRVGSAVPLGSPVHLFFEINGGSAPYQVAAQLEGLERDGTWRELGPPMTRDGADRSQGFTLDTKTTWPGGDYRLRVTVRDSASTTAEGVLGFRLN